MINFTKHSVSATMAFIVVASTALSLPATVSVAQGLVLEEIIVTARKRAESLQDAPLAVSAFSGDFLEDAGIQSLGDITEIVPNLQISRPSRDSNITIRGVGPARGATNTTELGVGVYIDDVFLLKPQGQLLDLAEIEQVQVLRGPQGTLFGKNTTGGAILVTTKKPDEEFGGYIQATVGNDGRRNAQGSIDVPLGDNFLTKLTLTSVKADGFFQDPVNGTELSDDDRLGAFLQLRWLTSESFTVDFSLFYNKIRENLLAQRGCTVTNPDSQIGLNVLVTPATGDKTLHDFCREVETVHGGRAPYFSPRAYDLDALQSSIQLNWDISDSHSFKSTTSWRNQDTPNITYTNTYVGFPENQQSVEDGDSTQISQEFTFSGDFLDDRLRYTAGFYFLDDDSTTGLRDTPLGVDGVWASRTADVPAPFVAALTQNNRLGQEDDNQTYAVYSQWSFDATEQLELTLGVRYGYEDRSISTFRQEAVTAGDFYAPLGGIDVGVAALVDADVFFSQAAGLGPVPFQEPIILEAEQTFESFTPAASIAYSIPDGAFGEGVNKASFYLSYTEGYKAGGFSDFGLGIILQQAPVLAADLGITLENALQQFEEEEIENIEFGFKLDAWDNRLRLNLAVFNQDYKDIQLFVARPDPRPGVIGSLQGITNAGKAEIRGIEAEFTLLPAEGWLVNFTAGYSDGDIIEFNDTTPDPDNVGQSLLLDRSDEDLPSLPEKTFSLAVQYAWETNMGDWLARVDAFYRDELYWGFDALTFDLPIAREASTSDSYTLFNARLQWQVADNFSVALWGKNLGDEEYSDGGVGEANNLGIASAVISPPRRYGIDLRYDF